MLSNFLVQELVTVFIFHPCVVQLIYSRVNQYLPPFISVLHNIVAKGLRMFSHDFDSNIPIPFCHIANRHTDRQPDSQTDKHTDRSEDIAALFQETGKRMTARKQDKRRAKRSVNDVK